MIDVTKLKKTNSPIDKMNYDTAQQANTSQPKVAQPIAPYDLLAKLQDLMPDFLRHNPNLEQPRPLSELASRWQAVESRREHLSLHPGFILFYAWGEIYIEREPEHLVWDNLIQIGQNNPQDALWWMEDIGQAIHCIGGLTADEPDLFISKLRQQYTQAMQSIKKQRIGGPSERK